MPCGAFWGADDIRKMSEKNTLKGLRVTMKKHPTSLKLEEPLKSKLDAYNDPDNPLILYDGICLNYIKISSFFIIILILKVQ